MEKEKQLMVNQQGESAINVFGTVEGFETGQRMAKVFSQSDLVPQQFKGNLGNCLIALNMSQRMKADPLMVMQSLFVVHGKPGFEAKFLIACFNASGRFAPIRYEWIGKEGEDSFGCRAVTYDRTNGEQLKGVPVTIKMAKDEGWYGKPGSKWKTMPGLMLQYRAATFLIRTTAPEISLGFQTKEEIEDADFVELTDDVKVQEEIQQQGNKEEIAIPEEETTSPASPAKETQPIGVQQEPNFFNQ